MTIGSLLSAAIVANGIVAKTPAVKIVENFFISFSLLWAAEVQPNLKHFIHYVQK
jgi:hypothetical protein